MKIFVVAEKRSAGTEFASVVGDPKFDALGYSDLDKWGKEKGYLEGDKYIISWAMGHLYKDIAPGDIDPSWRLGHKLTSPKEYRLEGLIQGLQRTPVADKYKERQRKILASLFNRSDINAVYNACDADEEGEGIFDDIFVHLGGKKRGYPVYRFWNTGSYKSKVAVKKAIDTILPSTDVRYKRLLDKRRARNDLDYSTGMKITKAAVESYNEPLYMGRVKGVCVGLIGDRLLEIKNFVSKPYWTIEAKYKNLTLSHFYYVEDEVFDEDGNETKTKRKEENYFDLDEAKKVKEDVSNNKELEIITYKTAQAAHRSPHLPLSGSMFAIKMMEKHKVSYPDANAILDYLRTEGFTTYPGTNGRYFHTDDAEKAEQALDVANKYFGTNAPFDINNEVFNNKKAEQQNHAPLSPTEKVPTSSDIERWKKNKLPGIKEGYEMIAKHVLSKFLEEDLIESQTLIGKSPKGHLFGLNGQKALKQGWRTFMEEEMEDTTFNMAGASVGAILPVGDVQIIERKTRKPAPHTIKTLLDVLLNITRVFDKQIEEEKDPGKRKQLKKYRSLMKSAQGIGTDRTRGNIIKDLFTNKVFTKGSKNAIDLSEMGWKMYYIYPSLLKNIVFTAQWESSFDDIANGVITYNDFIANMDGILMDKMIPEILDNVGKKVKPSPERKRAVRVRISGSSCPLCSNEVDETEKAYICSEVKFEKKKMSGCKFIVSKDMSKTLGRVLSGKEDLERFCASSESSPIKENKHGVWFNPAEKYMASVIWDNSGQKQEDPNVFIEAKKMFKYKGRFIWKNFNGQNITATQAKKILSGETIEVKRKSKKTGNTYTCKIKLAEEDGKVFMLPFSNEKK